MSRLSLLAVGIIAWFGGLGILFPEFALDALAASQPYGTHTWWKDAHGGSSWLSWSGAPPEIPGLRRARWMGDWPVPVPSGYIRSCLDDDNDNNVNDIGEDTAHPIGPAWLLLHIFSTPSRRSASRRKLIRELSPLRAVPQTYHHLIEVKFVLGRPNATQYDGLDAWESEDQLQAEMREHGDLIRLDNLLHGENMNEGKSWEWIRHVARDGGREAQWLIKCDDDTIPIMPNLLPWLATLDPTVPTYFGNPLMHRAHNLFFMEGLLYGMSWGVAKTLATANVRTEDVQYAIPEDCRIGELMASLPSKPQSHSPVGSPSSATEGRREFPHGLKPAIGPRPDAASAHLHPSTHAPDPRTGLLRIDLSHFIGGHWHPFVYCASRAFAWHLFKTDEESYAKGWLKAVDELARAEREWMWDVPERSRDLAGAAR